MFFIYILLCAFIAPLTQSKLVPHNTTNDDVHSSQKSSNYDAGEDEIVSIRHRRSVNEITIKTTLDGVSKEIHLQPTDGFFAGAKTNVWVARQNNRGNQLEYILQQNIMERVNIKFYQDKKTASFVSHVINKRGVSEFNGIIDSDRVVRPLTKSIRKRRDLLTKLDNKLDENDYENFHVIHKRQIYSQDNLGQQFGKNWRQQYGQNWGQQFRQNSGQQSGQNWRQQYGQNWGQQFRQNSGQQSGQNWRQQYGQNWGQQFRQNSGQQSGQNWRQHYGQNWGQQLGKPNIVYPEILVFVDQSLFSLFKYDVVETVAYILTLWSGVDLKYSEMENPKVRLSIAGIILCRHQPVNIDPFKVTGDLLTNFDYFLYGEKKFEFKKDYDIGVLMGANPKFNGGTAGIAGVAGACSSDDSKKSILSSTVVLDDAEFLGIRVAAHEMAHLFGAPHDGEQAPSYFKGPGAENCPWREGYLMSYETINTKQFYFSPCTKEIMSVFFSQQSSNCLRNDPAVNREDKQLLRILPGRYMSIDEQCQKQGYWKAQYNNASICLRGIWCVGSNGYSVPKNVPALEGTTCDFGSYCFNGECVKITKDMIPKDAHPELVFPSPYMPALGKTSDQQCKELGKRPINSAIVDCKLFCMTIKSEGYSTDSAQDGTSCQKNGFCHNGKCQKVNFKNIINAENLETLNVPDTLADTLADNECRTQGYSSKVRTEGCTIYCLKKVFRKIYMGHMIAPDGFPCKPNSFCQSGVCSKYGSQYHFHT